MTAAGAALTGVHVLIALTPLFDMVAERLLNVPEAARESARLGLRIMTPWTWAIAHRRFQQGVLIRRGRSRTLGLGTVVRLASNALVLLSMASFTALPGIAVGATGIAVGVSMEAAFVAWLVRPIARDELPPRPPEVEPLTRRAFLRFYLPLALTPLLTLVIQPMGAAAMCCSSPLV